MKFKNSIGVKKQSSFRKSIAFIVLLSFFCSFTQIYAVGGQFNVNLTVGADITVPTVPTSLSATAISSSQIDLSWTASTDNVAVTAYRVFRDSVFIATSTLVSYSDIGLNPSTTYTYTVSAVDASYNVSAQSASAVATTFATPVVATPPGSGPVSGQRQSPVIYDLVVTPSTKGAVIKWKTTQPTQASLSWGKTQQYELGSSGETFYSIEHTATLRDLDSATRYTFKISALNAYGVYGKVDNQSFATLLLETGKLNASDFVATPKTSSIDLTWNNPKVDDFSEVRVVRSSNYYPADENDGQVVYQGGAENFSDKDVVVGTRYYYALFVKYSDGSYSSGLLANGRIPLDGEVVTPYDPFDYLPASPRVHPIINQLTFTDFDFIQNGKKIGTINIGKKVEIDGSQNLTVSLAYEKVPEVLKSIVVTLSYPDEPNKTFAFLLKVNKDKTAYEATIGALKTSGVYGVKISIVDFKNQGLKKIVGSLSASVQTAIDQNISFSKLLVMFIINNILNIILLILLLSLIYRALKDMVNRNRNQKIIIPPVLGKVIAQDMHPVVEDKTKDNHPMNIN